MNNRENAVVQEMTASLLLDEPLMNSLATDGAPTSEDFIRHFNASCEVLTLVAEEASARRILHLVSRELTRRRRAADRLADYLMRAGEEVLEARREAKRAARTGAR